MTLTHAMTTIDSKDPRELAKFWTAALNAQVKQDFEGYFVILDWEGGPAIGLQKVPEEPAGKNRVHLDLHTDDRHAAVGRLVGLGAAIVDEQKVPGMSWTVLADPEGNLFCVGQPG
ncbi:VOC family protein [Actinocrispum sp. NPDC049592]|uniref:VOC family protein n=1 Tax=Actinocrispum sp. NPDC049592 TaxID=3154835 RepID=UPI00341F8B50